MLRVWEARCILDTNTSRIVERIRGSSKAGRMQARMDLYELAGRAGPDRDFNYALLDLGGLVCRARILGAVVSGAAILSTGAVGADEPPAMLSPTMGGSST